MLNSKETPENLRDIIFVDLSSSGIEGLKLNRFTGELEFPPDVNNDNLFAFSRTLSDEKLHRVLFDPAYISEHTEALNRIVHRIYRQIGDTKEIMESGLKYDITVINPGHWGEQFPTTTGHYHLPIGGEGSRVTASPDFYQLIHGDVFALLQKETPHGTEVKILHPKPKEWMLFPPEYAHSIVNIGDDPAVFTNICVRAPHLNYEPILDHRGMAYYVLQDEINGFRLERNPNYTTVLPPADSRCELAISTFEGIPHDEPFFNLLRYRLPALQFLTHPDNFPEVFFPNPIKPISNISP